MRWMRLLPALLIAALGAALAYVGAPWSVIALACGMFLVPYVYVRAKAILDARARAAGRHGSMLEDWTLLAVGLLFCAASVFTFLQSDWRMGVVMLAFFGGAVALNVATIRRKLRTRRFHALRVGVEGGRNIPADRAHVLSISIGVLAVGSIIFFVGTTAPLFIRGIGAFMALMGAVLLVLWTSGFLRQFLRFEPEGLVFGRRRYEYRVPWDNIAGVRTVEIADTTLLFLQVAKIPAIAVTPPGARLKVYRHVRRNGFCIAPATFGMDVPPLLAALTRYIRDPRAREELAPRAAAPSAVALPHVRLP